MNFRYLNIFQISGYLVVEPHIDLFTLLYFLVYLYQIKQGRSPGEIWVTSRFSSWDLRQKVQKSHRNKY